MHAVRMHYKTAGFTLIEILVVIFIVSIVALAATLNFSNYGNGRVVDAESYRLKQILNLTAQTAILEQTDLGVGFWENGYNIWRYDVVNNSWQLIQNERVLTAHTLPDVVHFELHINRLNQILPTNSDSLRGPQLWFSSVGAALPAEISVISEDIVDKVVIENNGVAEVLKE